MLSNTLFSNKCYLLNKIYFSVPLSSHNSKFIDFLLLLSQNVYHSYFFFSNFVFSFLVCCCTHNAHSLTKYLVLVMIVHGKLAIELYANDCETVSIIIPSIVFSLSHLFLFSNKFVVAFACENCIHRCVDLSISHNEC